jgi:hypothetical protein
MQAQAPNRNEMVEARKNQIADFREPCPKDPTLIGEWLKSMRGALGLSQAGVRWQEAVMIARLHNPGFATVHVDELVSLQMVFDLRPPYTYPTWTYRDTMNFRRTVTLPENIMARVSKTVYAFVKSKIPTELRRYHFGVAEDDGFGLIAALRKLECGEAEQIDILEARRQALKCPELKSFPDFKADLQQLHQDWIMAANRGTIVPSDALSPRKLREILTSCLSDVLPSFDTWLADPEHKNKDFITHLNKATSLYQTIFASLKRKAQASVDVESSTSLYHNSEDNYDRNLGASKPSGGPWQRTSDRIDRQTNSWNKRPRTDRYGKGKGKGEFNDGRGKGKGKGESSGRDRSIPRRRWTRDSGQSNWTSYLHHEIDGCEVWEEEHQDEDEDAACQQAPEGDDMY